MVAIAFLAAGLLNWYFKKHPTWLLASPLLPLIAWGISAVCLRKQWESWRYSIGSDTIEMSHGWWFRQYRVVARGRIQHVDFNSGPLDRRFGLVQVVICTAGATVGMIPGVRLERAQQLRNELMSGQTPT